MFHDDLRVKIDDYVFFVYTLTKFIPKEELYGVTSQLRKATLSIALNYIEGYARQSKKSIKYFYDISYGSLKESKYLVEFSNKMGYIPEEDLKRAVAMNDVIGAMLWTAIKGIKADI
ncbi:four helix bundle protein [Patescibacteria group bacterium]|nr:four helix bundle protein [Patescibacteria group bacterium]